MHIYSVPGPHDAEAYSVIKVGFFEMIDQDATQFAGIYVQRLHRTK